METPKAAEKKSMPNKKFKLPSGKEVEILPFKGKHIREAQRLMNGDESLYHSALFSVACTIDGKRLTIEELDEIDGKDYLTLIQETQSVFT